MLKCHPFVVAILVFLALRIGLSYFELPTTCRDGWASSSIGRRGACSWYGGVGINWSAVLVIIVSIAGAVLTFRVVDGPARREREARSVAAQEEYRRRRAQEAEEEAAKQRRKAERIHLANTDTQRSAGPGVLV